MDWEQLPLGFSGGGTGSGESGLDRWRENRQSAMEALAAREGIPLGHRVRVDFENGPPLEGILYLDKESLFLPTKREPHLMLRVGTSTFEKDDVAAIIRLD